LFGSGFSLEQKYVMISLIILAPINQNYSTHEEALLSVGKEITAAWEPMKTRALLSLGVPAQLALLVASIVFLVVTGLTHFLAGRRKAVNNLRIFNNLASSKERIVFETVRDLAKKKKFINTIAVVEDVQKRTGKQLNSKEVLNILNTLEENGLVQKALILRRNMPRLTWKA
jgi:hypothetical protein